MKTSTVIVFLLLLLASCSKRNDFKQIDAFVKKSQAENAGRNLAQVSGKTGCFTDEVTEEKLLKEISELENNKISRSKSIINGLDLSKFSPSEAAYIEKSKENIQTQGLDVSECSNVKCLFSKIYPNSNGIEGHFHYYFYLKMGYVLNTVKTLPLTRLPDDYTYQSVLFSREELQYFYHLTKILSPSFQKLPTLSTINRLPKNMYLPQYGDATCGLAGGFLDNGYILLMDNCLSTDKNSILDSNFIPLTSHEISHRLDYKIDRNRFSETKEWLDLSGWYLKENVDAKTGAVIRQWALKESTGDVKNDGFVRDYAATQPGEDFADSVGFFRSKANEMSVKSPRKYAWISKNLYQGKSFTSEGISENYTEYLTSFGMSNLPVIVEKCLANKSVFETYSDQAIIESFVGYDRDLIQCVLGGVNSYLTAGIQNLKENEVNACSFFTSGEKSIRTRVFAGLIEFIKSDLSKNIEIGNQLLQLAELMNKVQEEIDPREIFIACQEDENKKSCFDDKLSMTLTSLSESYTEKIPNQVNSFKATYLKDNTYEFVSSKIAEIFSHLFTGSDLAFKREAEKRWNSCKSNKTSVEGDILLKPFSGDTQYISASILNCLNSNAESDLYKILDKASKKLGVSIASEGIKKYVLSLYIDNFTATLQDLVKKEVTAEKAKVATTRTAIHSKVSEDMLQNSQWISGILSDSDAVPVCIDTFNQKVKTELESYTGLLGTLNFHNLNDFLGDEKVCKTISSSPRLKSVYKKNKDEKLKAAFSVLKSLVIDSSESYARACKKQYPKKDSANAKNRKNCITQKATWKSITSKALENWSSEKSITTDKYAGQDYLDDNKKELQELVVKEMELL